ncbi:MAG: hypothetical protein ACTSR1_01830 [Candidatus Heimdallarchaeota archaeon]
MSNSIEFYLVDIYSNLSFENYQLKNDISLNFFEPIPLNLIPPTTSDIYLSIISALFGFTMLLLLLTLRNSSLPSWGVRKIVHMVGGVYVAIIVFCFKTMLGILVAICLFILIFLILLIFSRLKILKQFFMLNCRNGENKFTFLVNTTVTLLVLFSLMIIFHDYPVCYTAGALAISLADTAGEVFGRKIPIIKYKIFNEKSLIGSLSVMIFSILSLIIAALIYGYSMDINWLWKLLIGGIVCSIIEAVSWKWTDNLFLPITSCLFMFWLIV